MATRKQTKGEKLYEKLYALHDQSLSDGGEAEAAKRALHRELKKYAKRVHDLLALFVIQSSARYPTADEWLNDAPPSARSARAKSGGIDAADGIEMHALKLVHGLLGSFIGMSEHELLATALWCLHTHVFDLYSHTPRLILTSPVRGCGKSRTLKVLKQLVRRPRLSGNVTAAVFYHRLENERCSWLLDEGDNLSNLISIPICAPPSTTDTSVAAPSSACTRASRKPFTCSRRLRLRQSVACRCR